MSERLMGEPRRRALTAEEREELAARKEDGDQSMVCGFDGWATAHPEGGIVIPHNGHEDPLSSEEAREFAIALLQAADHAEFGMGEWRDSGWCPEQKCRATGPQGEWCCFPLGHEVGGCPAEHSWEMS